MAPERRLTRGQVAYRLGVDVSTVRRLEARGELHPEIGAGGIRYFAFHEVRNLQRRRVSTVRDRTEEMKLAAFELFRDGLDWRDVAIELRYDPYRVYRLWRLYVVDMKSGSVHDDED